jgi:hypothetical protein
LAAIGDLKRWETAVFRLGSHLDSDNRKELSQRRKLELDRPVRVVIPRPTLCDTERNNSYEWLT